MSAPSEWDTTDPGEVARLRRQLRLSESARRGLADRLELMQALNESLTAELAPGFRPIAARGAEQLVERTRAATYLPPLGRLTKWRVR